MKLDPHVHTFFSGRTTIHPLSLILNESYNSPEGVYRCAKARGMDLVAITDHDVIDGALTIADRPDVIVGCEVTGVFPNDRVMPFIEPRDMGGPALLDSVHLTTRRVRSRPLLPLGKTRSRPRVETAFVTTNLRGCCVRVPARRRTNGYSSVR